MLKNSSMNFHSQRLIFTKIQAVEQVFDMSDDFLRTALDAKNAGVWITGRTKYRML